MHVALLTSANGWRGSGASYAKLARLPPPRLGPVEVEEWIRRVASLEKRIPVRVAPGRVLDGERAATSPHASAFLAAGFRLTTAGLRWYAS